MMADEGSLITQLRTAAAHLLRCDDAELRIEPCATGKYNHTAFAFLPNRELDPLVVQLAPADNPALHLFYEHRMMRRLPAIHDLLRRQEDLPVAKILHHARKLPQAGGRDVLIQQRLPGSPLSEVPTNREQVLHAAGRLLRRVHQIRGPHFGYPQNITDQGEPTQSPAASSSSWAEAFPVMWQRLLEDLTACGGYSPNEASAFTQLLHAHRGAFSHNVPPALLHMDVWDQNILVTSEGEFSGLVDWDRAMFGDPEIEFAVLDYCGISTPAFWQGYGRPDPRRNCPQAAVRHVFYLLYELQKYIVIRRARQGDPAGADLFRRRVAHLLQRSGLDLPPILQTFSSGASS